MKRAPPPPRLLEESLDQAPHDIEKERLRGVERFGPAFDMGDHIAIIQLQQITIHLQASLLGKLRNTAFDDDHKITDFSYLVDVVELERDRTIATLHELRQRLSGTSTPLAESTPLQTPSPDSSKIDLGVLTPPPESTPVRKAPTERSQSVIHHPPKQDVKPVQRQPTWTRDLGQSGDPSGDDDTVSLSSHHTNHRKRSSILHFLKHNRTHSTAFDKDRLSPAAEEPSRQKSVASMAPIRDGFEENTTPQQAQGGAPQRPSYDRWNDSATDVWNKPNYERRDTVNLAPDAAPSDGLQRQMSNTSSVVSNPLLSHPLNTSHPSNPHLSHPLTPPSPVMTLRSNSTFSQSTYAHSAFSILTSTQTGSTSVNVPTPTPENDYLGFCKCAWKIQNGDRKGAMSKCRDVEPWSRHPTSAANAMMYLTCQSNKCAFRSNFTARDTDKIWERVITAESKGVRLRWAFLAKTHVAQKVVTKQQFSFKCPFCVFSCGQSGVYLGVDCYINHISSEHRGKAISEIVLYKTSCINDRRAEDGEEFDINIWPDESAVSKERQRGDWSSDDVPWANDCGPKEGHDSMFSTNEPWNEGLSDFSYRGEHDRTELE